MKYARILILIAATPFLLAALPGAEHYLGAKQAERAGRYVDALKAYQAVAAVEGPLEPYARVGVGRCLALSGNADGGLRALADLIRDENAGPWDRHAALDMGMALQRLNRHQDAARLFAPLDSDIPQLWWFEPYRLLMARSLIEAPETRDRGFAIVRRVVEETTSPTKRMDAARLLVRSSNADDRLAAVEGMVRTREFAEALPHLPGLLGAVAGDPALMPRWEYLQGRGLIATGQSKPGRDALVAVADRYPESPYARRALDYAARNFVEAGDMAAAAELYNRLVKGHPIGEETGDALWWWAEKLRSTGRAVEAGAQYEMLARLCPQHDRADDALLAAARTRHDIAADREAVANVSALAQQFPLSPLVPEAFVLSAIWRMDANDPAGAMADFERAATVRLGDFYSHRAVERLAMAGAGEHIAGENLAVDGYGSFVRPVRMLAPAPAPASSAWQGQDWYERLRFFGAHGFEEVEWEALGLMPQLRKYPDAAPLYAALADAGAASSAMDLAKAFDWGRIGELLTFEAMRVEYPLAYWPIVLDTSAETGVDPLLLLAMMRQESLYRPRAESHAGARGLMQVMPATAKWMAQKEFAITPDNIANLDDPRQSLRMGAYYIKRQIENSNGNLVYALSSYNAGPGNTNKWRNAMTSNDLDLYIDSMTYAETRGYVRRVLGNYAAYHSLYPVLLH